jgi:hypothetical protein
LLTGQLNLLLISSLCVFRLASSAPNSLSKGLHNAVARADPVVTGYMSLDLLSNESDNENKDNNKYKSNDKSKDNDENKSDNKSGNNNKSKSNNENKGDNKIKVI